MGLVPFLRHVEPYDGESLFGIMLRAAAKNHAPNFRWAEKLLPSRARRWQTGQPNINYYAEEILELSELLFVSADRLYDSTIHRYATVFQLGDRLLRSHELLFLNRHDVSRLASRRTTKYCPFCLSSGLYHRLLWDLVPVTTCLTHSVLLIDHCPACNGRVTHEQICKGKHKCGYELSAAEGCPPPGGKEALGGQALVLALLRGEHFHPSGPYANPVFCLSSPQFFALFDILALLIVRASNRLEGLKAEGLETDRGVPRLGWRQKLTNRSHHALFLPALRILTGWPESFFTFLEDCRAKDADRVFARLLREHRPSQELTALKQGGLSFVYEAVREYLGPRGSVVPRVSDRPPKGAKRAGGAAREGRGAQQAEKA